MNKFSSAKRKILQEISETTNRPIPHNVKRIYEKAFSDSFTLDQKFRNLEDPLSFIHSAHIQGLVDMTEQTTHKLRKQMEETTQFSKSMYKKIISREGNQFDFENLKQNSDKMNTLENDENFIMKAQKTLKIKQPSEVLVLLQKKRKINESNAQRIRKMRTPRQYRHKIAQILSTGDQAAREQFGYQHLKFIDTPSFQEKCKHVQFFDLLKEKNQHHIISNQQFDIFMNQPIQKLMSKMQFQVIEDSCEFNRPSQQLFYDFNNNLKFWKNPSNKSNMMQPAEKKTQKLKKKDEQVLSQFYRFNKKQIDVNSICDFAMRKITCQTLSIYFGLKRQHKEKLLMDKNNSNLDELYNDLQRQYEYAHELKIKSKTQRIPAKYAETQCQTIRILDQKEFDEYFSQTTKIILNKIAKLNKLREKTIKGAKSQQKFVLMKNTCDDMSQNLFKLLVMILKGQKFYPRQRSKQKNYAPFFTYSDLFDIQNRQQVEKKILELIYTKLSEFECDKVDGIQKCKIIKIYVEEKEKNNQILQIISQQSV